MDLAISRNMRFYRGRKILITGHTGFKGTWLTVMLHCLGAIVTGYALKEEPESLYSKICGNELIKSIHGNLSDYAQLQQVVRDFQPEVVIHMAAFGFIKECHANPLRAYRDNVLGTANLLEVLRSSETVRSIVLVSTDKVYENCGDGVMYVENDTLGGTGPYASSKTCMEFLARDYYETYFQSSGRIGLATVRASNVLGGGDHVKSRLIPTILKAVADGHPVDLRHPEQIRPWQSVLDALNGYLTVGRLLYQAPQTYSEPWNIGPTKEGIRTVGWVFERIKNSFQGLDSRHVLEKVVEENAVLGLDIRKSLARLDWKPLMSVENTIDNVVDFFRKQEQGIPERSICIRQISEFLGGCHEKTLG